MRVRERCGGDFAVGLQAGGLVCGGFGEEEEDAGEVVELGCGGGEGDGEEEFCYSPAWWEVGASGRCGGAGVPGDGVAEGGAGLEGEGEVGVPGVEVGC